MLFINQFSIHLEICMCVCAFNVFMYLFLIWLFYFSLFVLVVVCAYSRLLKQISTEDPNSWDCQRKRSQQ